MVQRDLKKEKGTHSFWGSLHGNRPSTVIPAKRGARVPGPTMGRLRWVKNERDGVTLFLERPEALRSGSRNAPCFAWLMRGDGGGRLFDASPHSQQSPIVILQIAPGLIDRRGGHHLRRIRIVRDVQCALQKTPSLPSS